MLKVTFLTGEYPPMQGGIADYTAHLAQHLNLLKIEPAILISRKYRSFGIQDSGFGIRDSGSKVEDGLFYAGDDEREIPVYPHITGWSGRCWLEIEQYLKKYQPDILHIQYQAAAFDLGGWVNWLPWYIRQRNLPTKIVTTFHDLRIPYLFPKAGRLRWWTVLALAKYSHAVICTNHADRLTLQGYPWGQHLTEIPLGNNIAVNPPPDYQRERWRQKLGIPVNGLVLAYFGFLNESKGGEDLIATLKMLIEEGFDAYLLLIGGDVGDSDPNNEAYAKRIRTQIKTAHLEKRIIQTGYVSLPEVSANFLAADMVVLPYRDGVSFRRTTLIAALTHGRPIISTTPPQPISQLTPEKNILLVSPQDIPGLCAAVKRLATNPALQSELSQGAKTLSTLFAWDKIATQTLGVYDDRLNVD